MIRTVETLRLYALLFSVPLALVWALRLPPWTGAPLAAGLALLSLYYLTLSARTDVRAGRTPRLGLAVDREELDRETLEAAPAVFAIGAIVMGLVLLVAEPLQGALMLALVAAAAWRARLPVRDRHFLIEYAAPGALLVAPATLLRAGDQIAPHVYAATWLTAATLGLAILLCLVRDRGEDRALAARTTATSLTRDGARALATVWIVAIPTLAMYGSVGAWWAWLATLVFVWMAFGALACLWASRPGWAAAIVTLAGGLACTIVALTVA